MQYLPDSILNHYYQLFYYTAKLQLFSGSCAVFCSKICFNSTIEIQLLLIAISAVHIAMGNLYDGVYDPNGALYLYLLYVFLHTCIVLYHFLQALSFSFTSKNLKHGRKPTV